MTEVADESEDVAIDGDDDDSEGYGSEDGGDGDWVMWWKLDKVSSVHWEQHLSMQIYTICDPLPKSDCSW